MEKWLKKGQIRRNLWAKVPPVLPALLMMPIAPVVSIHLEGDNTKEFLPASCTKASNSPPLKSGLCNFPYNPKNSIVGKGDKQKKISFQITLCFATNYYIAAHLFDRSLSVKVFHGVPIPGFS